MLKKLSTKTRWAIGVVSALVLLVVCAGIVYAANYSGRALPGTTVAGMPLARHLGRRRTGLVMVVLAAAGAGLAAGLDGIPVLIGAGLAGLASGGMLVVAPLVCHELSLRGHKRLMPQVMALGPAGAGRDADAGGVVVGVAWGTTMSEVSAALPSRSVPGLTVVQLNGASDPVREGPSAGEVLSRMRLSLGARTISFPVPAFFDHVATREAMWSERSVKRVLSVVRRASLAVFGVGALDALNGALPSQVYKGGHLTARDQTVLRRQNVVGDVCTVLLRADGSWRDVTLNARATGPTPAQLARIPRRLCVAAGTGKSRALLAALRARTATDLVVDDATARAVLELAEVRGQTGGGSR